MQNRAALGERSSGNDQQNAVKMSEKMQDKQYTFEDYRRIVDTLRSEEGCPWDRAQTKESLKPFMIEEMVDGGCSGEYQ